MLVRELTLAELIFTAYVMLDGEEGKDFSYYKHDLEWWKYRLWMRIN